MLRSGVEFKMQNHQLIELHTIRVQFCRFTIMVGVSVCFAAPEKIQVYSSSQDEEHLEQTAGGESTIMVNCNVI